MVNSKRGQALALIEAGNQSTRDLQHVFSSVDMARGTGYDARVDALWFSGISKPLSVNIASPDGMSTIEAGILTEEVALMLADIELERYRSTPDKLLTARELYMRLELNRLLVVPNEIKRLGFSDTLCRLGGAAVLSGNEVALSVAGGIYHDLRQVK